MFTKKGFVFLQVYAKFAVLTVIPLLVIKESFVPYGTKDMPISPSGERLQTNIP